MAHPGMFSQAYLGQLFMAHQLCRCCVLLTVRRVFNRSVVSFEINNILPKGRMEMNGNDELIIHAINYIREKLKKRPDEVTIANFRTLEAWPKSTSTSTPTTTIIIAHNGHRTDEVLVTKLANIIPLWQTRSQGSYLSIGQEKEALFLHICLG